MSHLLWKLYITFSDSKELHRGLGGGERRGGVLLRADPSRWRGSAMSQPSLLRFMKVMKQMLWELRIFHQAHTFPAKSAKAVLEIFKEKEAPFFSSPI